MTHVNPPTFYAQIFNLSRQANYTSLSAHLVRRVQARQSAPKQDWNEPAAIIRCIEPVSISQ